MAMTVGITPPIIGSLTIQRNTNMLKILKKVSFCRFIGFFVKMQSPDCPPRFYRMRHKPHNTLTLNNIHNNVSRK